MTNWTDKNMTLADFERLLEVYGSDRTRWPVEARSGAGQLVARDKAARRLLAEAECLDRALERAPLPSLAREAELAERILQSARRSPRIVHAARAPAVSPAASGPVSGSGNVITIPASRSRLRPRWLSTRTVFGGAAGTLAASLALGVLIGLSSLPQTVMPALEQMTGIRLSTTSQILAQIDLLDEDLI
jgi:hypothetical protein